jgi:predicted transcriptional regulator
MTDKQEVIDALSTMPENASLDEIIGDLCILAAVRRGRAAIAAGRFKTQEEVEQLVASWFPQSPSQS